MKSEIHPSSYRLVVFKDMSNGEQFLTKSCVEDQRNRNIRRRKRVSNIQTRDF